MNDNEFDRSPSALRIGGRKRLNWKTLAIIVLLHALAIIGLARAFAPDLTQSIVNSATSLVTVTVRTEEPEESPAPEQEPVPDEGAAAEEGKQAKPKPVSAPEVTLPVKPSPVPRVASTGDASASGATEQGAGTGAGGEGYGTGSGRSGSGQGNGVAVKAVKIAGDINAARDYPVPEGGREARFGTSVTIAITVGTDGRPTACRIHKPSPFPETDRITCQLAMERFRFRPATNRNGDPVESVYGWRQDFFAAQ